MTRERFKGHISISFGSTGDGDRAFTLQLQDETSRSVIVEINISALEWGQALTSLAHRPVEYWLNPSGPEVAGSTYEHKTIPIWMPRIRHIPDVDSKRGTLDAKPFEDVVRYAEIEGWRARLEDLQNMHKRRSDIDPVPVRQLREASGWPIEGAEGSVYDVTFTRHVDAAGKPVKFRR